MNEIKRFLTSEHEVSMRHFLLALWLGPSLISCGSDDSKSTGAAATASSIVGTWRSDCTKLSVISSFVVSYTNTETDSKLELTEYSGESCLSGLVIDTTLRIYKIGDKVAGSEAYKIDYTTQKVTRTYLDASEVKSANRTKAYGITDWEVSKEREITGKKYDAESDAQPSSASVSYQIVKIDGTSYQIGDTASGDGTSDEKRPTALRSNLSFKKQ